MLARLFSVCISKRRFLMSKFELKDYEDKAFFVSITKSNKENAPLKGRGYNMKMTHKHAHYEILNVYSANHNVALYVYNKKYTIPPNSFILIPPYTPHCVERTFHSTRLLLNLSSKFGEMVFDFLGLDIHDFFSNSVLSYSPKQISEFYSLAKKMIIEMRKYGNENPTPSFRLLAAQFVEILNRSVSSPAPQVFLSDTSEISMITDYLKAHYYTHVTLDDLSEKFKMNKFSLCKKFRRETGYSVVDFLTQIRVNHSRDLLENSLMKMDEITSKVGFESVAYFSRVFKKYTGTSPTAYRKKLLLADVDKD